MLNYYLFNKPYGVICQFSPVAGKQTLSHFLNVKKDVYPVGRLDTDSEGLLLLTNDKTLNAKLLKPEKKIEKTYLAQVEGKVTDEKLKILRSGVQINVDGLLYKTKTSLVQKIEMPAFLWERNPPIRIRKTVPDEWLSITIVEGKNRQVRKMTASIGHPTLRLIRVQMGKLKLGNLKSGEFITIKINSII